MNILEGLPETKLTPAEENALAVQKTDDSINTLIEHNLREAFPYARTCYPSLEDGESLQACYDGLRKAAKRFRPNQQRFFAYAKADIRGALCKIARTRDVVRRGPRELESLPDETDLHNEDSDEAVQPLKPLPALMRSSVEPDFNSINAREFWDIVQPILQSLLPEESMVIQLHFRGNLNLREIGSMLRLSRERIRQCKNSGLAKIKIKLAERL